MASQNIEHLRRYGPTPMPDLPNPSVSPMDRADGVWNFRHNPKTGGVSGSVKAVAYLKGDHRPAEVLTAFFEANPLLARPLYEGGQHQRSGFKVNISSEFVDAVDEALNRAADDWEVSEA